MAACAARRRYFRLARFIRARLERWAGMDTAAPEKQPNNVTKAEFWKNVCDALPKVKNLPWGEGVRRFCPMERRYQTEWDKDRSMAVVEMPDGSLLYMMTSITPRTRITSRSNSGISDGAVGVMLLRSYRLGHSVRASCCQFLDIAYFGSGEVLSETPYEIDRAASFRRSRCRRAQALGDRQLGRAGARRAHLHREGQLAVPV